MPKIEHVSVYGIESSIKAAKYSYAIDTDNCTSELTNGIKNILSCPTGQGHDSALKGIIVQFDLTFSQNAWQQAERYGHFDIISSQSKMHRISKLSLLKQCNKYVDKRIIDICQEKIDYYNYLQETLVGNPFNEETKEALANKLREAKLDILYNIPCGYELTARITTNYLQLKTIYQQRLHHELPDWQYFCDWCDTLPRFKELTRK